MSKSVIQVVACVIIALFFAFNAQAEHEQHKGHKHQHKTKCGHKETQHGNHADYQHGKHKHKKHDNHYDECAEETSTKTTETKDAAETTGDATQKN